MTALVTGQLARAEVQRRQAALIVQEHRRAPYQCVYPFSSHLARLAIAVEADVARQRAATTMPTPTKPAATLATV